MKRSLTTLLSFSLLLGLGAVTTTACVDPPAKKGADVVQGNTGVFITMAEVDDSLNDKITGDRYQITYGKDDMWQGAPDGALVTIVEYSDFQCPYCTKLSDSLKEVAKAYPDDVRIVFKHFPLGMHKRARPASEAVLAAHAQGKGWELHDLVFENRNALEDTDLIGYAEKAGVPDIAKFKQDLENHTYAAQVDADTKQGQQFGVASTPSWFLNGMPQRGAKKPEQIKEIIEKEIAFAKGVIDAGSKREEVYARIMKAAKTKRAAPKRNPKKKGKQAGKPDPAVNYAVPTDERPQFGPDEALVTIIEYSDFECPYCRKVLPTMKQIEEEYGDKVRVIFRHQPLPMHKNAPGAALASLAAHKQGKFWEMHDGLFAKAEKRALGPAAYTEIAGQIGLDVAQFEADMKDPEVAKMLAEDQAVAKQFAVGGTPGFFVNGRFVNGARPFEFFKPIIEQEIEKAEAFMAENKNVPAEELYDAMAKNWETEVKVPPPPPTADFQRRDIPLEGLASKGNLKNPEITLVECSDFDCPYCGRGAELVEQVFAAPEYKDKVAFYFANFPLPMHKDAEGAHRAAVAAGLQGKFFEMHDLLFADRKKRGEAAYKEMAAQLGLDVDKFLTDWNSESTKQRILDDKALCSKFGVSGTPNFFVNGRSMRGAVPFARAKVVFDEELNGGFEATQAKAKAKAEADAKAKGKDGKDKAAPADAKKEKKDKTEKTEKAG